MPQTVIARSANEILALRDRWDWLYSQCRATIFQSFKWNWIASRVFAEREFPYVIYSEADHGQALLPLCINRRRNSLACLGDVLFDYRDVLAIGEDDATMAAWSEAARLGLPFSSGGLLASASPQWSAFQLNQFYRSPHVRVSDGSADLFACKHTRSASRLRKLQRMGVELRKYAPPTAALLRWIYEQKASQPPEAGENVFSDPCRIEFMAEITSTGPLQEEVFTLEIQQRCIAALVTLRESDCRRFYTIWFDQNWSRHSPGISLIYEVTRRSLAEGLDCDYMTGEQSYKMRFATSVEQLYWVDASVEQMKAAGRNRMELAA
ncbi:MAG TPA: GNAT family N-acetyltransferase [Terriglobales bacterium]|nr:GNAT family N-acetyltransferase [Terriglobales bacterium]